MDLRLEQPEDRSAVRNLHVAAFGDHGIVVADLVDALRSGVAADVGLSLVAEHHGEVVGHVRSPGACSTLDGGSSTCGCSAPLP